MAALPVGELVLETSSAHWGFTEHRYFGHAVFEELLGRETLTGLTVLSALGRQLPAEHLGVIDDLAVALTLADPRIWPLKLTRLLAAYGGTVAALAGGLSIQEGARIGPWTCKQSAELLCTLSAELGERAKSPEDVRRSILGHLEKTRILAGFGTPFRDQDERLIAFRQRIIARGRHTLPYWRLFEAIAIPIAEMRGIRPNIGIGLAAACLDIGVEPSEIGPLATALVHHMFLAHAVEQVSAPADALRILPTECVSYVGQHPRTSPRAEQSAR